jgi:hypothetical protein
LDLRGVVMSAAVETERAPLGALDLARYRAEELHAMIAELEAKVAEATARVERHRRAARGDDR